MQQILFLFALLFLPRAYANDDEALNAAAKACSSLVGETTFATAPYHVRLIHESEGEFTILARLPDGRFEVKKRGKPDPVIMSFSGKGRLALAGSAAGRKLIEDRFLARVKRPDDLPYAFLLEIFRNRSSIVRKGEAVKPLIARYDKLIKEIDPSLNYNQFVKDVVNRISRSNLHEPTLEQKRIMLELAKKIKATDGEDIIRSAVLRFKAGDGFTTWLASSNGFDNWLETRLDKIPPDIDAHYSWQFYENGLGTFQGGDGSRHTPFEFAVGPYYPQDHPQHQDRLTQKILQLKEAPSEALAKEIVDEHKAKIDAFTARVTEEAGGSRPMIIAVPPREDSQTTNYLADALARAYSWDQDSSLVGRSSDASPRSQVGQANAYYRLRNAAGSYVYRAKKERDVTGKTVVIVDDIATTGVTVSEIRRLLYDAGAAKVYIFTLGQTPEPKPIP